MAKPPLPPYDIQELRSDLHHLIQPIIGEHRITQQYSPSPERAHTIERLYLALALVDVAAGKRPINGIDVRMMRTRHGTGFFSNETPEVREQIKARKVAQPPVETPPAKPPSTSWAAKPDMSFVHEEDEEKYKAGFWKFWKS